MTEIFPSQDRVSMSKNVCRMILALSASISLPAEQILRRRLRSLRDRLEPPPAAGFRPVSRGLGHAIAASCAASFSSFCRCFLLARVSPDRESPSSLIRCLQHSSSMER